MSIHRPISHRSQRLERTQEAGGSKGKQCWPIQDGGFQQWRGRREEYRDIPTQKANIWPLVWNATPTSASHNPSYISNLSRLLNELTVLCASLSLSSGPPSTGTSALAVAREDPVEVVMLCGSYWTLMAHVLERQSLRTMCSQPRPHVQ